MVEFSRILWTKTRFMIKEIQKERVISLALPINCVPNEFTVSFGHFAYMVGVAIMPE